MKLVEFITGSKKICKSCHKAFSVEPLACPKCGALIKTHKLEKVGVVIGGFIGAVVYIFRRLNDLESVYNELGFIDKSQIDELFKASFEKLYAEQGWAHGFIKHEIIGVFSFIGNVIVGVFAGFILAFAIKKIVLVVRAKKSQSNNTPKESE